MLAIFFSVLNVDITGLLEFLHNCKRRGRPTGPNVLVWQRHVFSFSEVFWPKEEYSYVSLVQYLFYKQSLELALNIELLYSIDIFCIRFLVSLYQYVHFV